jgi:uncharacterized membrane protein
MSKVDVFTETIINLPLEKVAAYAADPDRAPKWYTNIKSVRWQTAKPLAENSRIAFTAYFLGRKMEYTYEVTEFIPGKKLVMQTAEGPFPMETTYTWQAVDERRTRMTLRNRGIPTGFSGLLTPLLKIAMKRANQKDLKRLKQLLEG